MRVLVVEDCEERIKGFITRRPADAELHISTSGHEALLALNEQRWDLVFLDHDLSFEAGIGRPAPGEINGYDVARKIGEMHEERRPRMVVVHSWNPEGARRICMVLSKAGVRHAREPYSEFTYVLWRLWIPPADQSRAALPPKCEYANPWAGRCGQPPPCKDHARLKCWCGKPAVRGCPEASSLVCGQPLCNVCRCRCRARENVPESFPVDPEES